MRKNKLLTDRWFPIPKKALEHPVQTRIKYSPRQYKVIAAGRRSFKTERFLKRRCIIKSAFDSDFRDSLFMLGAPTRAQAKLIFWEDIKKLTPKYCLEGKPREAELTLNMKNGNKVIVVGLEEYARVEGTRWSWVGITEFQKTSPNFWGESLQPILNDTGGEGILEGRPLGKNHFYDLFLKEKTDPEAWESAHWTSEEILTEEQINRAKSDMAIEDYKREYLADFESGGQRVYYAYKEEDYPEGNHKLKQKDFSRPFIVACDFNAMERPMTWNVGQKEGHYTYWIKTLQYQYTNTIKMCDYLDDYLKTWESYPKSIYFYGDYAGTHHTSNSAFSDWEIVMDYYKKKTNVELRIQPSGEIRDRVAATNAQLCNSMNERRQFVDPKECYPLIRDWLSVQWKDKEGLPALDGSDPRFTHGSDAVDYYNVYEYPIQGLTLSKQW